MSHFLEHYRLSDLTQLFNEIKSALDKDGVLIIEVPHCDMRIHSDVRNNDTPHLLFFSKDSLSLLLQKFGFQVLFIDTVGEEYATFEENNKIIYSKANVFKTRFKPMYNKTPKGLQNVIRSLVRVYYKIKSSRLLVDKYYPSLPQVTYGGNRDSLRVVAKISK